MAKSGSDDDNIAPKSGVSSAHFKLIENHPDFYKVAGSIFMPVLLLGETGTGKEISARAIHDNSPRRAEPFLAVNCAAIPPAMIESELLGYEKGAFTGADNRHTGYFEQANKGTLFLDEIAEMPPHLQSKLLRVLNDGTFYRLGGRKEIAVDVRIIAATNRDVLNSLITSGSSKSDHGLRQDMYYRVAGYQFELPPVRELKKDGVLQIAKFMVENIAKKYSLQSKILSLNANKKILRHSWPGNLRELRNTLERAVVTGDHPDLVLEKDIHIRTWGPAPKSLREEVSQAGQQAARRHGSLYLVAHFEKAMITMALDINSHNLAKTARYFRTTKANLIERMEKLHIPSEPDGP